MPTWVSVGGYPSRHLLPWGRENRAWYLLWDTQLGVCDAFGRKLENTAFGVALYYAGGDVNAKVIRRNPSVRDDDVHLGLPVGAGLVLHCGSYLLRLRVGCTPSEVLRIMQGSLQTYFLNGFEAYAAVSCGHPR